MRTVKVLTVGLLCAFVAVGVVQADSNAVSAKTNFELKADAQRIAAGELVSVDVFLKNVSDVAVYQVQVAATGGRQGGLELESIVIDKDREDFVFGDAQVIDAVDNTRARSGALMITGSTDVVDARYLVTYNFRATRNASGTFNVAIQAGEETFLLAPDSTKIAARAGTGVEVVVGRTSGRTIKGRN
ncbi:MAG: hypothetical protein ACYTHJ_03940 [Planctomycetota bacterium]|jgi:hypothetical protein